jgi:hypothetical protein
MKNCCFGPDFPPQNGYPAHVNIKLATTPEEMRRWAAQWRETGIALEEVKRDELANLTEEQALKASDMLLDLAHRYQRRSRTSGLVRQQARFHRKSR